MTDYTTEQNHGLSTLFASPIEIRDSASLLEGAVSTSAVPLFHYGADTLSIFGDRFSNDNDVRSEDTVSVDVPLFPSLASGSATAEVVNTEHSDTYLVRITKLENRIKKFLSFEDNWDGDGATRISERAVYSALDFLDVLKHTRPGRVPDSAAPSPDGEIVIYWHNPNSYVEVNFDGTPLLSLCWGDDKTEIELVEDDHGNLSDQVDGQVWRTLESFLQQHFP